MERIVAESGLRRERYGSRSGERAGEPREDAEVGVKRHLGESEQEAGADCPARVSIATPLGAFVVLSLGSSKLALPKHLAHFRLFLSGASHMHAPLRRRE